jgi:hypothetical protein
MPFGCGNEMALIRPANASPRPPTTGQNIGPCQHGLAVPVGRHLSDHDRLIGFPRGHWPSGSPCAGDTWGFARSSVTYGLPVVSKTARYRLTSPEKAALPNIDRLNDRPRRASSSSDMNRLTIDYRWSIIWHGARRRTRRPVPLKHASWPLRELFVVA